MLTRRETPVRIRYVSGNVAIEARFHAWNARSTPAP